MKRNKDMGNSLGLMEDAIRVNGEMESKMGRGSKEGV